MWKLNTSLSLSSFYSTHSPDGSLPARARTTPITGLNPNDAHGYHFPLVRVDPQAFEIQTSPQWMCVAKLRLASGVNFANTTADRHNAWKCGYDAFWFDDGALMVMRGKVYSIDTQYQRGLSAVDKAWHSDSVLCPAESVHHSPG